MTRFLKTYSLLLAAFVTALPCPSGVLAVDIGKPAPAFEGKSYEGAPVSLAQYKGKIVVLEWFNPDCPFVRKHYDHGHMQALQRDAIAAGAVWLTINSTGPGHPNFRKPEQGAELKKDFKIASTELVLDSDGSIGKLYQAKTTPHMFVIAADGTVVYDGALDDDPDPSADPGKSKNYVTAALKAIRDGKPLGDSLTKPYGCSVKYAE